MIYFRVFLQSQCNSCASLNIYDMFVGSALRCHSAIGWCCPAHFPVTFFAATSLLSYGRARCIDAMDSRWAQRNPTEEEIPLTQKPTNCLNKFSGWPSTAVACCFLLQTKRAFTWAVLADERCWGDKGGESCEEKVLLILDSEWRNWRWINSLDPCLRLELLSRVSSRVCGTTVAWGKNSWWTIGSKFALNRRAFRVHLGNGIPGVIPKIKAAPQRSEAKESKFDTSTH